MAGLSLTEVPLPAAATTVTSGRRRRHSSVGLSSLSDAARSKLQASSIINNSSSNSSSNSGWGRSGGGIADFRSGIVLPPSLFGSSGDFATTTSNGGGGGGFKSSSSSSSSGSQIVGGSSRRTERLAGNTSHGGRALMSRSSSDSKASRSAAADTKIMVLGVASVGKSALVVRFLTNRFIWEYDPTLESTYKHVTTIDEEPVVMEILDTAGQEDIVTREGEARWADGYVLVYAINDRASFNAVTGLKRWLDDVRKTNVQCVLVANKADLLHERRVQFSEGEALAQDMACAFYETSASDGGSDITELFHDLHREVKRRKMVEAKGRRRSSAQQVRNVFNRVLNKIGNAS